VVYLGKLSPVETVTGIELEYELVIDLGISPDAARQAEKEGEQEHEEVASIQLCGALVITRLHTDRSHSLVGDSW